MSPSQPPRHTLRESQDASQLLWWPPGTHYYARHVQVPVHSTPATPPTSADAVGRVTTTSSDGLWWGYRSGSTPQPGHLFDQMGRWVALHPFVLAFLLT